MKSLRVLIALALVMYMTGAWNFVLAQETETSPFSITLAPVQFANVKGNIGKFEAINWMPNTSVEGISNVTFVKDINKNVSLDVEGSEYSNDNGTAHLTLKDGDWAFLKIDYNAFRKYYDNTGGVFYDQVSGTPWPAQFSGVKANSPDLQMDISFFKLEAGLGPVSDPFFDVIYQHNSKDGEKSLTKWAYTYITPSNLYRKIAPSWESVNNTSDKITVTEKKEIAGITIKGSQNAEFDYNHNNAYMQYLYNGSTTPSFQNELYSQNEYPDAKLLGAGVRFEKWMHNDSTFAGFGYHFNHTANTELMQNMVQNDVTGAVVNFTGGGNQSLWNYSHASEAEHVFTGNINTNLTSNLAFIADGRYEHLGSEGNSFYYAQGPTATAGGAPVNGSATSDILSQMENRKDHEGEHVALRYSGLPHTTLYAESEMEQGRNWVWEYYNNLFAAFSASDFTIERLNRTQKESWTLGGKIVPNRFFIFTTQVKQHWEDNQYDTVSLTGTPTNQAFLDELKVNGIEEASVLTWKPSHWLQNSLKYQFYNTDYMPRETSLGSGVGDNPISKNHMLTSKFTYDISVEPIDTLMLMVSYSHVQSYVRTLEVAQGSLSVPTFNSGDNSWLFSGSYSPTENLTWTNTVCYTLSNNYVDFSTGIPYGSDFRELNFTTGFDYIFHKWLKIGPKYEYASYRDNSLAGAGNYSANIFMLDAKFSW